MKRPLPSLWNRKSAFALQAARSALHGNAAVLARLVLAELRQVREIDLHVAADEQIESAVAIVVGEAAARPTIRRRAAPARSVMSVNVPSWLFR